MEESQYAKVFADQFDLYLRKLDALDAEYREKRAAILKELITRAYVQPIASLSARVEQILLERETTPKV